MASVFNLRRAAVGADEGAEPQARAMRGGAHVLQDMGTILRERREAMGISLAEAEAATRIRQKYLSALESNEWALLPGEVVGRGFLRNYSSYLGLDTTEMMERRRAATDPRLAASLSNASVGAAMPPERPIDYRPINVDLKDEPEAIQARDIRLRPILTGLGAIAAVLLLGWGVFTFGDDVVRAMANLPTRLAEVASTAEEALPIEEPRATPIVGGQEASQRTTGPQSVREGSSATNAVAATSANAEAAAVDAPADEAANPVAPDAEGDGTNGGAVAGDEGNQPAGDEAPASAPVTETESLEETGQNAADNPSGDGETGGETTEDAAVDAATESTEPPAEPAAEPPAEPTATFTPLPPTPVLPTPVPLPTETAAPPEPAPVAAAPAPACPDPGTQILSPGVNQAVAGTVEILGTATNPNFQNYKLEWAPTGTESFNWFTGAQVPINSGVLGYFDSAIAGNQAITLRLTVVDNTGNFPPPCDVTINVQN